MNKDHLKKSCEKKFPDSDYSRLYWFMEEVAKLNFCVATGWEADEVSVSKDCAIRGRIFKTTKNYTRLQMPNGKEIKLDRLTYEDIVRYLPVRGFEGQHRHCDADSFDHPEMRE
ncbi:MAG: hypothetical protein KKF56_00740 [Nanoarchaeota archaeon]|nr:hypothetical protein [Nanoarchaeota archaeon]